MVLKLESRLIKEMTGNEERATREWQATEVPSWTRTRNAAVTGRCLKPHDTLCLKKTHGDNWN